MDTQQNPALKNLKPGDPVRVEIYYPDEILVVPAKFYSISTKGRVIVKAEDGIPVRVDSKRVTPIEMDQDEDTRPAQNRRTMLAP